MMFWKLNKKEKKMLRIKDVLVSLTTENQDRLVRLESAIWKDVEKDVVRTVESGLTAKEKLQLFK